MEDRECGGDGDDYNNEDEDGRLSVNLIGVDA